MLDFDNNKNDLKEIAEKVGIFKRASSVNLISGCLHRDFLTAPPSSFKTKYICAIYLALHEERLCGWDGMDGMVIIGRR